MASSQSTVTGGGKGVRPTATTQSATDVTPTLEIRDSTDAVVTDRVAWLGFAYWAIPSNHPVGTYSARVRLNAGPLGPQAAQGVAESDPLSFEVQNPVVTVASTTWCWAR